MAGIEIQSFKINLLLVSGLLMLTSILVVAEDLVPLPPLPKETHDFLETCGTKLKPNCGEEIKIGVYQNGKISDECCKQLIDEGRACHDKFIEITAPFYPEPSRSEASAKGAELWIDCSAV